MEALLKEKVSVVVNAASPDLDVLASSAGWMDLVPAEQNASLKMLFCKALFTDFDLWLRSFVGPHLQMGGPPSGGCTEIYGKLAANTSGGSRVHGRVSVTFVESSSLMATDYMVPVVISMGHTSEIGRRTSKQSSGVFFTAQDTISETASTDAGEDDMGMGFSWSSEFSAYSWMEDLDKEQMRFLASL
mmetsp:Transcript_25296/g.53725  ORF Transcript_25296/g.53725 Transcript_25296/m.53725 type:complete len:188 (+) Transcript_25296:200-763(+)